MDNELIQSARRLALDPSPENTIRHFLLLSRHGIINIDNVFPGILNAGQEAADYQSSYNQWSGTSNMAYELADYGANLAQSLLDSLKKAGFEFKVEVEVVDEDEDEEVDEGDEEELLGDILGEWDT